MDRSVIKNNTRSLVLMGASLLFIGVALGAFGAHGLKKILTPELLETWETAVRYQIIHGLGLLALGALAQSSDLKFLGARRCFLVGVLLFSGNCYFYCLSGIKAFAMIVPVGGTLLLVGWTLVVKEVYNSKEVSKL